MHLTVAICTWNRADSLRRTLASLAKLSLPDMRVSVVVIDNNCTDHTQDVVAAAALPMPVACVREPQSGLSNARNAAVRQARDNGSDYILFTDDDIEMDRDWLVAYETAFLSHPASIVFGGPITPVFAQEPATWIRQNMSALRGPFGLVDHGGEDREMSREHDMPFGANMAYRIDALEPSPFDPGLGVAPGRRMGGEESDVSRRLLHRHAQQWVYVARARVWHHLAESAVQPGYLYMHLRTTGHLAGRDPSATTRSVFWPSSFPPRWLVRQYATTWLLRRMLWLTRNRDGSYARVFSHEAILRGHLDMYTRPDTAGGHYAR